MSFRSELYKVPDLDYWKRSLELLGHTQSPELNAILDDISFSATLRYLLVRATPQNAQMEMNNFSPADKVVLLAELKAFLLQHPERPPRVNEMVAFLLEHLAEPAAAQQA